MATKGIKLSSERRNPMRSRVEAAKVKAISVPKGNPIKLRPKAPSATPIADLMSGKRGKILPMANACRANAA
jgi:hypothetical protein